MEKGERINLYLRAIMNWGKQAQVDMAFEECGELITVLAQDKRGRVTEEEILTELADVSIMVEQVAVMLGYNKFEEEKDRKLKKLEKRLNDYEMKNNKSN
jgi:NTP pyrophosphatase (non-canonical NTP hydrolase)